MGCWQETCGLTNTPIYENEPCVMVILDNYWLDRIVGNTHSPIGLQSSIAQWRVVKSIHYGTYNDYGWLKEVDDATSPASAIFFHRKVWNWAIQSIPDTDIENTFVLAPFYKDFTVTSELHDFAKLCNMAASLRRDIFSGLKFRGCQECIDERLQREFIELPAQILYHRKERYC